MRADVDAVMRGCRWGSPMPICLALLFCRPLLLFVSAAQMPSAVLRERLLSFFPLGEFDLGRACHTRSDQVLEQ